jgi:hypothetical protein
MRNYLQGKYILRNPSKYVGDPKNIVFRSSWELKLLRFFDSNPNVLKYSSEEIVIPYYDKATGRNRRYFVDFAAMIKQKDGVVKKYLIEVKPLKQTIAPKKKSNNSKGYLEEVTTYITNRCKWDAAEDFCKKNGWEWMILTEKNLGL